jgi:hypothetical protein
MGQSFGEQGDGTGGGSRDDHARRLAGGVENLPGQPEVGFVRQKQLITQVLPYFS